MKTFGIALTAMVALGLSTGAAHSSAPQLGQYAVKNAATTYAEICLTSKPNTTKGTYGTWYGVTYDGNPIPQQNGEWAIAPNPKGTMQVDLWGMNNAGAGIYGADAIEVSESTLTGTWTKFSTTLNLVELYNLTSMVFEKYPCDPQPTAARAGNAPH